MHASNAIALGWVSWMDHAMEPTTDIVSVNKMLRVFTVINASLVSMV
jgi:hypothetical protein